MTYRDVTPLPLDALQDWGAAPSPECHDLPTLGLGLGPKGSCPSAWPSPVMPPNLPAKGHSVPQAMGRPPQEPHPPGPDRPRSIQPSPGQEWGGPATPTGCWGITQPAHAPVRTSHLSGMWSLLEREGDAPRQGPPLTPRANTGNHRPAPCAHPAPCRSHHWGRDPASQGATAVQRHHSHLSKAGGPYGPCPVPAPSPR